jgi:hypothetical protein
MVDHRAAPFRYLDVKILTPAAGRDGSLVPARLAAGTQVVLDRHCAVQDLLTLRYQLAGLGPAGVAPSGSQSLAISVAHLQHAASGWSPAPAPRCPTTAAAPGRPPPAPGYHLA